MLARRRGLSISRHMVECGLTVDPETEAVPPPRLMLDEAEQRALYDHVVRIAERTAEADTGEEAVLTRIRNALAFLADTRMREMVREGRAYELRVLLTELFGEPAASAAVDRLRARMSADGPD